MNYSLRDCSLNDLDFILHLKELTMKWYMQKIYGWDYEVQKQKTANEITKYGSNMKIIVVDNKDIGVTTFINSNDYYKVGLTIIHPDYQRKGIATDLINKYIDIAKANKKKIIIKTYKENPAKNLYLKLGFCIYKTDNTHIYLEINFNQ